MATNLSPLFNSIQFDQASFGGIAPGAVPLSAGKGLIYPALRKAGVTLGPQRTPSPAQYQDGIEEVNRLIGSLSCDRLFIFTNQRFEFPLNPGQKTFTIGIDPTGQATPDFSAPRPQFIERANIIQNNLRYPLALLTVLQWPQIRAQDLPTTIPQGLYNDRAYPLATLYLYGQPMAGCSLELFYWYLVPAFLSPDDVVLLPPGYEDALVLNLAVRLAPHFQREVPPAVARDAQLALMRLESINAPQPIADTGAGCGAGYMNIYSGEIK